MRAPPPLASLTLAWIASACSAPAANDADSRPTPPGDELESLPLGPLRSPWTVDYGRFEVLDDPSASEGPRVVEQTATSEVGQFNLALSDRRLDRAKLDVRLNALGGALDQGGGLVWRAVDARNYYVARWSPLEKNVRVYEIVDGFRTQLASANIDAGPGWHRLEVEFGDDWFRVALDGKQLVDARDTTFGGAGLVGLWTKADARTRFDGFSCSKGTP